MKYRYYYFPYFAVEETEAQIKKKKVPSHTARDLQSQGTKWDGLTPEPDLLHKTCEVVFYFMHVLGELYLLFRFPT